MALNLKKAAVLSAGMTWKLNRLRRYVESGRKFAIKNCL